jgi:hypothetical protein
MKNRKNIFGVIALAAIMTIVIGSCDNETTPGNETSIPTPTTADFDIGNLSQTVGSVTAVNITPKPGKSGGAITIYYNGSVTLPADIDTYPVTFDVAAATGWKAASGLSAGTLIINKGTPVFSLRQGSTFITNNSLTPFDFGQVELGTNKELTFTIQNTGNIALVLNGSPLIESTNPVFSITTQPSITSIATGATVTFVIRLTPTVVGDEYSKITIKDNTDSGQFIINVKGSGITP